MCSRSSQSSVDWKKEWKQSHIKFNYGAADPKMEARRANCCNGFPSVITYSWLENLNFALKAFLKTGEENVYMVSLQ